MLCYITCHRHMPALPLGADGAGAVAGQLTRDTGRVNVGRVKLHVFVDITYSCYSQLCITRALLL